MGDVMGEVRTIERDHGERIVRLEEKMNGVDEKIDAMAETMERIAGDVHKISLIMARRDGMEKAVKYITHAGAGLIGGLAAWFGTGGRHP